MKGSYILRGWALLLAISTSLHLYAQTGDYTVTERGADYKVLQKTTVENGTNRVHRYTELATGLNYRKNGQWLPAQEQITLLPTGGAAATQGRHQVYFPANIYNGVIEVVTPDGQHLKSRPLGISYDDGSNTVFIATLKSAQGYLTSSNQVTYRDAFTEFKADLVCTYRRGGFESDLVFRQQPPTPGDYGLDEGYSTLSLVTEFFNTADPVQIPAGYDDTFALQDTTLKFGKLTMTHGKAFAFKAGNTNAVSPRPSGGEGQGEGAVPVYKSWVKAEGRTFLIETVPVLDLADDLNALPLTASIAKLGKKTLLANSGFRSHVSGFREFPPAHGVTACTNQILLAAADFKSEPGVVLDYNEINTDKTDSIFHTGQTYFINGELYFSGTTTFEGGAIIKSVGLGGGGTVSINIDVDGALVCPVNVNQPAIFTSVNDDTVGELIFGSTGSPAFRDVDTFINFNCPNPALTNLHFYYVYRALSDWNASQNLLVKNCRFMDVGIAMELNSGSLSLQNVLINEVNNDSVIIFGDSGDVVAENVTCDGNFTSFSSGATDIYTNCLLTQPYGGIFYVSTNGSAWSSSTTPAYQSAATAHYYLASSSPYRDVGTTVITADLLAELQTLTTYAPQDGSAPDTSTPDLGYHYPLNEDSDHDSLPDWWEWHWFHNYNHTSTELDASGNSLASEYGNFASGTVTNDPNVVEFSIEATNDYVNYTNISVQLRLTAGEPAFYAVFVNQASVTNWLPYSVTNLALVLGVMDGTYNVVVGMKGVAAEATETWRAYEFYLDRVPPVLSITNPVLATGTATVIKPYLQLQGQADEPVYSLAYNISNAAGIFTNRDAFVSDQYFDTNRFDFTTNYFQAYDVPLVTNLNLITLRVTDRAGNIATTNFSVVLDYAGATNPPVVKLLWPLDGMAVSGTNITIRGTMSDETGNVVATVVNGDGTTNILTGLIERNNMFWIENVPLNGTNQISLQAIDASGNNMATTNFIVKPSAIQLTISQTPTGDALYQAFGSVSGMVSDPTATVTVNGTNATVQTTANAQGAYDWTAANAPIHGRGTATFDAIAAPAAGNGSPGNANAAVEMGVYITTINYRYNESIDTAYTFPYGTSHWGRTWNKHYHSQMQKDDTAPHYYGYVNDSFDYELAGSPYEIEKGWVLYEWDDLLDDTFESEYTDLIGTPWSHTYSYPGPNVTSLSAYTKSLNQNGSYFAKQNYVWSENGYPSFRKIARISAMTEVHLWTGGKAGVNRQNLFCGTCSATELFQPPLNGIYVPWAALCAAEEESTKSVWNNQPSQPIDKAGLILLGKQVGVDGKVWVVLPDNSEQDLTVKAPGVKHFNADVTQQKYKLAIKANGVSLDPKTINSKNCVGQNINFTLDWNPEKPPILSANNVQWTLGGTYVNKRLEPIYTDSSETYINDPTLLKFETTHAWWYDGKYDPAEKLVAEFKENVSFDNGQSASLNTSGLFSMHRPDVYYYGSLQVPSAVVINSNLKTKPGVLWVAAIHSHINGETGTTQLINGTQTNCAIMALLPGTNLLDNQEFYKESVHPVIADESYNVFNPVSNFTDVSDVPDIDIVGTTVLDLDFIDYIRFQPNDGINVTLGKIYWHIHAHVSNGVLSGTPDGFLSPDVDKSNEFPYWIHTQKNSKN